jgi:predicted nucleic acid-binding Zn ribbon protein
MNGESERGDRGAEADASPTPHVDCFTCGTPSPIDARACATCRTPVERRLHPAGDLPALPWAWWLGVVPAILVIALMVRRLGVSLALEGADPYGWLDLMVAAGGWGFIALGPLLLIHQYTTVLHTDGLVTPRLRRLSFASIPLTGVSMIPLIGLLPCLLAFRIGRPSEPREPEHERCPACSYALPHAHDHQRVRCPECGQELQWRMTRGLADRARWLLGTGGVLWIGVVGVLVLPATVLPAVRFRHTPELGEVLLILTLVATGGWAWWELKRRRRGWNDPAWRPSRVDILLGCSPLLLGLIATLVRGGD